MNRRPLPVLLHRCITLLVLTATVPLIAGCSSSTSADKQLAEMATENARRQAEQSQKMAEVQQELVALHRDVQSERKRLDQQRDEVAAEYRRLVLQAERDPLTAAAIWQLGLAIVCLAPLVLAYLALRQASMPADEELSLLLVDLLPEWTERPPPLPGSGKLMLPGDKYNQQDERPHDQ